MVPHILSLPVIFHSQATNSRNLEEYGLLWVATPSYDVITQLL